MRNKFRIFQTVLYVYVLSFSIPVFAQQQSTIDKTEKTEEVKKPEIPSIAEFVPLSSELSSRFSILKQEVDDQLNKFQPQDEFEDFDKNLHLLSKDLTSIQKDSKTGFNKLSSFKKELQRRSEIFDELGEPLQEVINDLSKWRSEWLKEKKKWQVWQDDVLVEKDLHQLKLVFARSHKTIDEALALVLQKLNDAVAFQKKNYKSKLLLNEMEARLDLMIENRKESVLLDASPPMFSKEYVDQFTNKLWYNVLRGINSIQIPGKQFFQDFWWVIFLQILTTLAIFMLIHRNIQFLDASSNFAFLVNRPIAAGLFLGAMFTFVFYEIEKTPGLWALLITAISGIAFAQLMSDILKSKMQVNFVYGIIVILIIIRLMALMSFPLPLYRIFIILFGLVAIIFSMHWISTNRQKDESKLHNWALYLFLIMSFAIITAEVIGKEGLGNYLFESLLRSIATLLTFSFFMYLIYAATELLFLTIAKKTNQNNIEDVKVSAHRASYLLYAVIVIYILIPVFLTIWDVFDNTGSAIDGVMGLSFTVGDMTFSLGLLIRVIFIFYLTFIFSIISQKLYLSNLMSKKKVAFGARYSISRLLHYIIMFIGFMIALSTLGFEITKLTIVLSAFGVGIGFGLQGVVNNFVSGLILMFNQPVREGDIIQIGEVWSKIKKIGLRATTVETSDEADLIIPNSDLIYNQVTNWTLSNRHIRLKIDVGVAYGSDIPLVIETLMATAMDNPKLLNKGNRVPQVLFLYFGESSLDFELRAWVIDTDDKMIVTSELNQEIDKRFRKANIEISFPQRDLHIKGVEKSTEK